jgi:mannan endo-1,6-alpha-mannosidase
MYNFTKGSQKWKTRVEGIISGAEVFFSKEPPNVMTEVACESNGKCNVDQQSFKAYLSRWMAATTKVAPFTYDILMPKLQASAQAAALQCSGPGNACGLRWTKGAEYDGTTGVGEQMSALEVFQSLLVPDSPGPANNVTGTSKGDPAAGTTPDEESIVAPSEITTGDKIGAGFLTTLILLGALGGAWWMVS